MQDLYVEHWEPVLCRSEEIAVNAGAPYFYRRLLKKALFLIDRQLYYKYLAPVIDEFLGRGVEVVCLHDYGASAYRHTGIKADQFPLLSTCPQFANGRPILRSRVKLSQIEEVMRQEEVNLVFALHGPNHYEISPPMRENAVWIQVQHGHDCFREKTGVAEADIFACYSPIWPTHFMAAATSNTHYVGCPAMDAVEFSDARIVTKYAIPQRGEIITYFANDHPRLTLVPQFLDRMWYRFVFNDDAWGTHLGWLYAFLSRKVVTELGLVRALRNYADEKNAVLIIKSRAKRKLSPRMVAMADRVLYDETYFPATNYELMKVSSLIVCIASTAQLEAAFFKTPAVSVYPSRLSSLFCNDLDKHFPFGLSAKTQTLESFVEDLRQARPRANDVAEFHIDEMFGPKDGLSASRIADLAAGMLQERRQQSAIDKSHGN